MKKRYEQQVFTFMGWLSRQNKINKISEFDLMFYNLDKIINDMDAEIDFVQIPNSALVKNKIDYSLYFAVVELYNSIVYYYRNFAKYNLKDERLENALRDWKDIVNLKPTLKEFFSELCRGKQK